MATKKPPLSDSPLSDEQTRLRLALKSTVAHFDDEDGAPPCRGLGSQSSRQNCANLLKIEGLGNDLGRAQLTRVLQERGPDATISGPATRGSKSTAAFACWRPFEEWRKREPKRRRPLPRHFHEHEKDRSEKDHEAEECHPVTSRPMSGGSLGDV